MEPAVFVQAELSHTASLFPSLRYELVWLALDRAKHRAPYSPERMGFLNAGSLVLGKSPIAVPVPSPAGKGHLERAIHSTFVFECALRFEPCFASYSSQFD